MVAFRGSTHIDVSHDLRFHRCTGTVAADSHTIKLLGIHQMGGEQEPEVRTTTALANGHLDPIGKVRLPPAATSHPS